MMNIKTLEHCENFLKVSNEMKKFVKIRLLNLINDIEHFPFSNGKYNEIIRIKNDFIITTYRQISVKNTP